MRSEKNPLQVLRATQRAILTLANKRMEIVGKIAALTTALRDVDAAIAKVGTAMQEQAPVLTQPVGRKPITPEGRANMARGQRLRWRRLRRAQANGTDPAAGTAKRGPKTEAGKEAIRAANRARWAKRRRERGTGVREE